LRGTIIRMTFSVSRRRLFVMFGTHSTYATGIKSDWILSDVGSLNNLIADVIFYPGNVADGQLLMVIDLNYDYRNSLMKRRPML
jgi:hypothetical protein